MFRSYILHWRGGGGNFRPQQWQQVSQRGQDSKWKLQSEDNLAKPLGRMLQAHRTGKRKCTSINKQGPNERNKHTGTPGHTLKRTSQRLLQVARPTSGPCWRQAKDSHRPRPGQVSCLAHSGRAAWKSNVSETACPRRRQRAESYGSHSLE